MKLEWDELNIIASFITRRPKEWRVHVEENGFEVTVANAIQARLLKMTLDEERMYIERFGAKKPSLARGVMTVYRGEESYEVKLEKDALHGWHITRVPGKLCFILLAKTLESAQQRITDNGWKFKFNET